MEVALFWFRRDLRLEDNIALYQAVKSGLPVVPIFIFDEDILSDLREGELTSDKRLIFIHRQLNAINNQLGKWNSTLLTFHGKPLEIWKSLNEKFKVKAVFTNHDYEPYAMQRDKEVGEMLKSKGIEFHTFKDQVIFEKNEVLKPDVKPYTVFTPYSKKWKEHFNENLLKQPKPVNFEKSFASLEFQPLRSLESMGFVNDESWVFPEINVSGSTISDYKQNRDFPYLKSGTSKLGVHLRFGTLSIRQAVALALEYKSETFLNELIWREFYMMILFHFPYVVKSSFRPEYDLIPWQNNTEYFELWKQGETGYPIVDAGMRELNETGYMHNRVRMIVASFLTKHLLIDWRWGEAYFAKKLLDFELASNNGGWQWAAGCGCDAAPYFRVFNPYLQAIKFDPDGVYIRKWVPEWEGFGYPEPIVNHEFARNRALEVYGGVLKG